MKWKEQVKFDSTISRHEIMITCKRKRSQSAANPYHTALQDEFAETADVADAVYFCFIPLLPSQINGEKIIVLQYVCVYAQTILKKISVQILLCISCNLCT